MGALKAHEVEAFLRKADPAIRFFLLYGPDQGLVSERADALARARLKGSDDPFALVRIDGDVLAGDPQRLADEAYTVALFGGSRVIRVRALSTRSIVPSLEPVLRGPPADATILVEAGELRGEAPLRKLFEGTQGALALPCYPDEQRDLLRLIDEELGAAGLRIAPEAKALLRAQLGGDRLASRQELRKIALYCHGAQVVTEEDVIAATGDVSALAVDAMLDPMGLGEVSTALKLFHRLLAEGMPASVIAGAALRHLQQLLIVRAEVDNGRGAAQAMAGLAPPIFYKRRGSFERQVVAWSAHDLEQATRTLAAAVIASRRQANIAEALTERALMTVATLARRRG